MTLDQFLRDNRTELIKRTRAKVAGRSAPPDNTTELEHGVPLFLSQLSATLEDQGLGGPDHSARASHAAHPTIGESAAVHGRDLLKFGFTIEQVVHDYGDVCQAVTELAEERGATLSIAEFHTLNRCLDNAIAGAVSSWSQERDRKLADKTTVETTQRVQREFLAKAGEALTASSLDYRMTLATVAQLAVPELADWCSVELLEPGATVPLQVAVAHADPRKVQYARELGERYPPDPNAPTGAPQVIRSGKSELYPEIPAALLEAGARDSEHLRLIRELRLESGMVVPLTGRARVLGAMSFIYADSGRRYTQSDLSFAEDFARRAAMAIENAQAHAALNAVLEFQEGFVAILGHDLRNPLSAIDMGAGMLRQLAVAANDARATRVLDRMKTSSRRMSRMIEQILDLTRSRLGGGLEMTFAETDLCAALTGIVDELRTSYPSRTVDLRCPPSLLGRWDRDRLEQVFSNLIGNAISYGLEVKPVTVEVREEAVDGPIRVEVHNHGPPIPEELQAKIFNPFRRGGRDSKAEQTAGLGLGLYISHTIVAAHRGEIDVRSNSAEGTTFRVTLPRRPNILPTQ